MSFEIASFNPFISVTKLLEKYLYKMCVDCNISSFLKIKASQSLCFFNPEQKLGYKALNIVCKDIKDIATKAHNHAVKIGAYGDDSEVAIINKIEEESREL